MVSVPDDEDLDLLRDPLEEESLLLSSSRLSLDSSELFEAKVFEASVKITI